jgi:hypothetical protein
MTSEPRRFLLYHTAGCHLCELAEELLVPLAARQGWNIERVDIAGDDELEARYGVRIPVLHDAAAGHEIGWPFDGAAVLAAFSG